MNYYFFSTKRKNDDKLLFIKLSITCFLCCILLVSSCVLYLKQFIYSSYLFLNIDLNDISTKTFSMGKQQQSLLKSKLKTTFRLKIFIYGQRDFSLTESVSLSQHGKTRFKILLGEMFTFSI